MKTTLQPEKRRAGRTAAECCGAPPPRSSEAETAERVAILAALADPTRLQIVDMLSRTDGDLCVCDIMAAFALQQPTISHHLKVLRETGLVNWEKRGLWVHYSLNFSRLDEIAAYLSMVVSSSLSDVMGRRNSA